MYGSEKVKWILTIDSVMTFHLLIRILSHVSREGHGVARSLFIEVLWKTAVVSPKLWS